MRFFKPTIYFLAFLTIFFSSIQSANAAWYNASWGYRKSHTVNASSGAGTNYQVKITTYYGSGTDSGGAMYLNSKSQADFDDIRFTASDGSTLLDYWLESKTDSNNAVFWVEVAADLSSSNQDIYIYYGNSGVSSTTNGSNTFLFFDDFSGASLDTDKWMTVNVDSTSQSGGILTTSTTNKDPNKIIADENGSGQTGDNVAMRARYQITGGSHADQRIGLGVKTATANGQGLNYVLHDFTNKNKHHFLDDALAWGTDNGGTFATNTWYTEEIYYNGTAVFGRFDDGTWYSWTRGGRSGYMALNTGGYMETVSNEWDFALIRKIIASEPAHSTWGTEETPPNPTEFISIVDPGNGTGTDYTSLSAWETGLQTDLTSATTQVFSGTLTSTIADNATVYLCRSGAYQTHYGTLVHTTSGQILIENITGSATEATNDVWYTNNTCNSANYFTISNGGNSAIAVAKCRTTTGAADTTAVTIDGWTTAATNYIKIWTDTAENYRHQGKWDEEKYRLENGVVIYEDFTRIDGLQFKGKSSGNPSNMIDVNISDGGEVQISNTILKGNFSSSDVPYGINLRWNTSGSRTAKIWNNIFYDIINGTTPKAIYSGGYYTAYIYNNTFYNCTTGIARNQGTTIVKNSIFQNTTDSFSGSIDSSSTNNLIEQSVEEGAFGASADSGTTTSTVANKLVQTGQNFLTTVKVGMVVKNTTDTTYSYVTVVDSDTQLSIANDIMATSEAYTIYTNMYGSPAFTDEANYDFHLDYSDTVAKDKGANLYADANLAITSDIDGSTRPNSATTFDIGADEAATEIYYSVGQNTTTHETGAGNVTVDATARTATFTVPQTATNMGVGDVIDYDTDNKKCYITEKVSTSIWKCQSATGGAPLGATGVVVNSIAHAYASLSAAEAGATDSSHLNTTNLVTGNYILNIPCYYDSGPDQTAVTVDGYTTGRANYIKIYTPNNTDTEVNQSQRHSGKWNDGKYRLEITDRANAAFYIWEDYVRVDGIQLATLAPTGSGRNGIGTYYQTAGANEILISNNIVKGHNHGTYTQKGIFISGDTAVAIGKVWNNIVFNMGAPGGDYGISIYGAATSYAYNNTIIGGQVGMYGISGAVFKNNLVQGATIAYFGTLGAGTGYNATNNASMGYTVTGGAVGDRTSQTFSFIDSANNDFHLASTDTGAKNYGVNLTADSYLPFRTDIDGEERGADWSIGADDGATTQVGTPAALPTSHDSGLVGHWSFDGADTTWTSATAGTTRDLSGNNNTGTMTNMNRSTSSVAGINGQGMKFDGVDDYVTTNLTPDISSGSSISYWVYPKATPSGTIWHLGSYDGSERFHVGSNTSNQLAVGIGGTLRTSTAAVLTVGRWNHVVVSANASTYDVYIDSVIKDSGQSYTNNPINRPIFLGARNNQATADYFSNVMLDDVRIYNRALSPTEITEQYNAGAARMTVSTQLTPSNLASGLVGYWTFNGDDTTWTSATAGTTNDISGNNDTGTLTNMSRSTTPVGGKIGQAFKFEGGTSAVALSGLGVDTGAGAKNTVSFWMKWDGTNGIMPFGWTSYDLWFNSGCFGFNTAQGNVFGVSSTGLANTWVYVTAVFYNGVPSAINNALYFNDEKKTISTCFGSTSASVSVGATAKISGWNNDANYKFRGLIDEVRIYNRALSDTEVSELYKLGSRKVEFQP